jgi:hypothetical protein
VHLLLVYIREAHAVDGRAPMPARGQPQIEEPQDLAERRRVARRCFASLGLADVPAVVDDIDDEVAALYAAAPDRLYLLDEEGRVVYRGGPGPFGFSVPDLSRALESHLASSGQE